MSGLLAEIPKFCSKVVLFRERGTDTIRDKVLEFKKKRIEVYEEEGLRNTVKRAFSVAKAGETLLYSPAFFSFGKYFKNEYDRGDQFVKIVKKLK
jgi:UDP-N-acetylmuramoylalanine-D-glutamate ligase